MLVFYSGRKTELSTASTVSLSKKKHAMTGLFLFRGKGAGQWILYHYSYIEQCRQHVF